MKPIEDLNVKVTYRVGLGDVKFPPKVFKQLTEIAEKGVELNDMETDYPEALEWLRDNIKGCDLEYEITETVLV